MGNFEVLILFLIVMYVLFVIARRLWPERAEDERTTAPFVKRRQRAMIWTTTLVGIAGAVSVIIVATPEMFPAKLSSHQFWTVGVDRDRITAQGRTRGWIPPFSQQRHLEPLVINFEYRNQFVRAIRDSESSPWLDTNGDPISASDIISRSGADVRLTDLVDAVLTESWVEGGLHDRAQPFWIPGGNIYPTQPSIARTLEMSVRSNGFELMVMATQIMWVVAGLLIVAGLGFDRWKFKRREPAATLPA